MLMCKNIYFRYKRSTDYWIVNQQMQKGNRLNYRKQRKNEYKKKKKKNSIKMGERRPHKSLATESPPDGGWGWVVTFSAFTVAFILDGIAYSFGLFFKEIYTYFNESKSLTSLVISCLNGTYLSTGE